MKKAEKNFYVLAHNIRSLHNVGSIFRTADALGVGKIFLTGYTGTPKNPIHAEKISKVALGAETWLPWEYHKSPYRLIKKFQEQKIKINQVEEGTQFGSEIDSKIELSAGDYIEAIILTQK